MISFDERYKNKRGIIVYRTVEMNYAQVVRSVREGYQPFLAQYVLSWYRFVKEYQRDTDPTNNYNTFDVYKLREDRLYPSMEHTISFSSAALERDYEGLRAVEQAMRRVDDSMIEKLQAHYKRNEYAPFPPGTESGVAPWVLPKGVYFEYNAHTLREKQLIIAAPLVLSWDESGPHTRYCVYLSNGQALYRTNWLKVPRRFKDPLKRHAKAIIKAQELAALTNWVMVELGELSNKQQRALGKAVLATFKEDWSIG